MDGTPRTLFDVDRGTLWRCDRCRKEYTFTLKRSALRNGDLLREVAGKFMFGRRLEYAIFTTKISDVYRIFGGTARKWVVALINMLGTVTESLKFGVTDFHIIRCNCENEACLGIVPVPATVCPVCIPRLKELYFSTAHHATPNEIRTRLEFPTDGAHGWPLDPVHIQVPRARRRGV